MSGRRVCWLFALALLAPAGAARADYSFQVPSLRLEARVQPDAGVEFSYTIVFANNEYGQAIDVVDIGLPHAGCPLSGVKAALNGRPLGDIRPSQYVQPGFEVHLSGCAIPPGGRGVFTASFACPDLVYRDTTRRDYAALQLTPTWFGEQFVTGQGSVEIAVHLPAGVQAEEVLWHDVGFKAKAWLGDHAVVYWSFAGPASRAYRVGVSFPRRVMRRVLSMSFGQLWGKFLKERPHVGLLLGALCLVLLGFLFFRFSGGTGCLVFLPLAAALLIFLVCWPLALLVFPFLLAALVAGNELLLARRRAHYLPAIAGREGGAIKRGLTAPEAAALLELPPGKVALLVVFGLLKKGLAKLVQRDPLTLAVDPRFVREDAAGREAFAGAAAREAGLAVHVYERLFLAALAKGGGEKPVAELSLLAPLRLLVSQTAEKLKGFDVEATREYYRFIIRKALAQARALGDLELRREAVERDFEWLALNEGCDPVLAGHHEPLWPRWLGGRSAGWGAGGPAPPAPAPGGRTTLGDLARSASGWFENQAGALANAVSPGSLGLKPPAGVVDLSGVDRATNSFFKALAEANAKGGGGGGHIGGGCACACAGCACACACAGGGR